jgi:NAD+ kinase
MSLLLLLLSNDLGGDGTYLRTAGIIEDTNTPILGLNTDPSRSIGFLCNNKIYNDMKEKQIEKIFENLDKENFEYFYRQRINFRMETPMTGEVTNKLVIKQKSYCVFKVLNEIFAAEKDTGKTSIYRLFVDQEDLGSFKSSGIIISTGTGSSGWLFSARRITQSDVRTILNYLGNGESIELVS